MYVPVCCLNNINGNMFRTICVLISAVWIQVMCFTDEDYQMTDDYFKTNYMEDDLPLFYSFAEVTERLHKEAKIDPVKVETINETYYKSCRFGPDVQPPEGKRRPFIVIEGNHRHSRDVIGIKLARRMGGRLLKMPPKCMGLLSTTLPASSELRRVFFGLSLYATAYNVKQLLNVGVPVVLNGYWTDQVAFVMEKRFQESPPQNHPLYHFPKDLFVPDVIFYLVKDESQTTDAQPKYPPPWKKRTLDIYKRFENPKVHIVNINEGFYKAVEDISNKLPEILGDTRELSYNPPRYLDPRYF